MLDIFDRIVIAGVIWSLNVKNFARSLILEFDTANETKDSSNLYSCGGGRFGESESSTLSELCRGPISRIEVFGPRTAYQEGRAVPERMTRFGGAS